MAQDPDLPGALPNMELIEAGALVVPMDNANQAVGAPFNLKAYGLVNLFLQNEIPVKWAISATKAKDGVDFTVDAERVLPSVVTTATKSFKAGPFIVEQQFATQALALAAGFGNNVAVYRTVADVTVDIRYTLKFKPYIGIGNVNTKIHKKIMEAAGIPGSETCGALTPICNWTMVDPLLVNSFACLTSHTDPHREDKSLVSNPPIRDAIRTYLQSGGNFIAQCAAVRFFEGEAIVEADAGHYITNSGITDAGNGSAHTFPEPNVPFVQIDGDVKVDQGGSWPDGVLPAGGAFTDNGYVVVDDASPVGSFQAAAGKLRSGIGGNVFYLGGHEYKADSVESANGMRMMLNTVFVPPQRPASCGFDFLNPGRVTLIKDTDPDNPWYDFTFELAGPSPQAATLQDPGVNECPADPLCADPENSPAWDRNDRATYTSIEPTTAASERYVWTETGVEEDGEAATLIALDDYQISWECKNVPLPASNPLCDPGSATFDFDACPVVVPSCALDAEWADGVISGEGASTLPFDVCADGHVMCRYVNQGGPTNDVCLESDNAIGDLRVLGEAATGQVSFTTAAVSLPASESSDSIFLSSFMPIADQGRWPGTVDHFVQPLPVTENADGSLVPDKSVVCADAEDTGCLAWDAGAVLLGQAPTAAEVDSDRRIGTGSDQRRVTYTQAASGDAVPRTLRIFDYGDAEAIEDERDLWEGMGIPFIAGDTDSEQLAREESQEVIRETLRQREAAITDLDTGLPSTVTFVAGDFFHGSPLVLGGPSNFFYLANDLEGNGKACDDAVDPNQGYRCFFEQQRRRRRVLLAPSNDGQLHAFDAGVYSGSVVSSQLVGAFDQGSGKELFAHIPRPMLLHSRVQLSTDHDFGIDGAVTTDDVFMDPVHTGTPDPADREWRTVVIGGYREGGRGLYALDLTQPDPVEPKSVVNFAGVADTEYVPVVGTTGVPACTAVDSSPPSGCSLPYPSVLWEFQDQCTFTDSSTVPPTVTIVPCDQDTNGYPDLAYSWSKVNTGRVLVLPDGETEPVVRFVAVFGGGIDPDHPADSGNFLYMVDIETGGTLYKRALVGAVPAEPAAVDVDRNGILDTLYVGTAAGFLYKTDISQAADLDTDGVASDTSQWAPFQIFDTEGRPIFFQPTVLFDANSGHYAVGFGTGDRENLWSSTGQNGRFYMILDTGFVAGVAPLASGPLTEAAFESIAVNADPATVNFLEAPVGLNQPGWVLELGPDERVVSDGLAISGLLAFTTFDPDHPDVCVFGGNGRIYTLLATNANALGGEGAQRGRPVEGFAGEPIVTPSGFTQQGSEPGTTLDPFEAAEIQAIRDSLMGLFPPDCRFGNFSLNVSSSLSSREVVPLAQIPVCIARKNWTEQF